MKFISILSSLVLAMTMSATTATAACQVGSVSEFVLVDTVTDTDVQPLSNNAVVVLAATGNMLSVRADTAGTVAYVDFEFDGGFVRSESIFPFALGGNPNGSAVDYTAFDPLVTVGVHTIRATAFCSTGTEIDTQLIEITVVDVATNAPTSPPTDVPTSAPTSAPTIPPTNVPTFPPTSPPTDTPTNAPTHAPTNEPTNGPTKAPTFPPTSPPTKHPTHGHGHDIYLPEGSNTWDKCDYEKTIIRGGGGHGHTDIRCDLPIDHYRYHEIVSFHAVPLGRWRQQEYLDCWVDYDDHGMMVHCDHSMRHGRRAQLHMLCCHGDHSYQSLDAEVRLEKTGPTEGH